MSNFGLYIIRVLHQTTTLHRGFWTSTCCILLEFYIKPQPVGVVVVAGLVVYY